MPHVNASIGRNWSDSAHNSFLVDQESGVNLSACVQSWSVAVVVDLIKCKDCRKARNKLFKDLFEQLVGMHQNRKANIFPRTQCGSIFKYTLTGRTNAYSILMNRNGSIKLGKKTKKKGNFWQIRHYTDGTTWSKATMSQHVYSDQMLWCM